MMNHINNNNNNSRNNEINRAKGQSRRWNKIFMEEMFIHKTSNCTNEKGKQKADKKGLKGKKECSKGRRQR